MIVFSSQEIAHFRAFGFVVLRGLLDPGEAATLGEEVATALADAYGRVGAAAEPRGAGGLNGDYLYDDHGYDRERWPTWREWAAGAASSPSRQTAVERLRLLGVLGEGDPR
jgi:hypothetical protein